MGISTKRKPGVYESLQHDRSITIDLYQSNVFKLKNMHNTFDGSTFTEGLSTLEYELLSEKQFENYKRILVKI